MIILYNHPTWADHTGYPIGSVARRLLNSLYCLKYKKSPRTGVESVVLQSEVS